MSLFSKKVECSFKWERVGVRLTANRQSELSFYRLLKATENRIEWIAATRRKNCNLCDCKNVVSIN